LAFQKKSVKKTKTKKNSKANNTLHSTPIAKEQIENHQA
jgi:hypothetical protein